MPRKSVIADENKAAKHTYLADEAGEVEEEENDDSSMLEMISIIQNFQKRKATKAPSKLSAFAIQKNALYDEARKNANNAVRDGVAYIEQYKTVIENLKAQEVLKDKHLQELSLFATQEDATRVVLEQFPPMFEDLSHRRAEIINETSAMLEAHSYERQQSRRMLIRNAKSRIEEDHEHQRIVTDASVLIKHYKALLLS